MGAQQLADIGVEHPAAGADAASVRASSEQSLQQLDVAFVSRGLRQLMAAVADVGAALPSSSNAALRCPLCNE